MAAEVDVSKLNVDSCITKKSQIKKKLELSSLSSLIDVVKIL